ncbi:unnamed protein product, partial [Ectocarpus sp. 12 AP-2014]
MQKSITSFFGGPKDGAADPPSPPKPRPPSAKPSPKAKPKAAKKAAKPAATKKPRRVVDGDGEDEATPAPHSPAKTSNTEEKGDGESLTPEKKTAVAAGKRKQAAEEAGGGEEEETAAAAAPRDGKAGDDELEGGEDAPAQKKPRRLRRLAEKKANAA